MDPMHRNIHSYPHQRDQLHYSPFPCPGTETIPPQTYAHRPPVWCSSYGYMPPVAGHGCCNHYPFVSPCAHHCPVSHPSYPIQYMPPPPPPSCYPMEHPHTSTGSPHCWGCLSHPSQPVPQRNVRIEEEELADGGRRKNDSLGPLLCMPPDHGNNKNGNQKPEDDDKGGFPLPLFWIPYKPEEKEMEKHDSKDSITKSGLEHVKEVGKPKVNEGSKNDRGIKRDIPVKDGSVEHGEKKVSRDTVKTKSPSPSKPSKLPPVCLRVDPLPRRKIANGSSQKEGSQSGEAKSKILNPSDNKKLSKISTNDVKEGKGMKTIKVVVGKTWQERNKDVDVETHVNQPEEMAKAENTSLECLCPSKELSREKDVTKEEAKEIGKRKLSDDEAAVVIQKLYRGFETRRWDPVKKLKQIAKLREEMGNVKHMIQAMESSSDTEGSCKQSTFISESIMSLLLRVDTVQGLHPSIREVRKAVVKELVSLQEKLDSLTRVKSVNSPQQESSSRFMEDVKLSENGSSETPSDSPKADGALYCENSEISEASPNREKLMENPEKEDEKSNEELGNDEASRRSREEALSPISWESRDDATDQENKDMHHELDLLLGEVNVGSDEVVTRTEVDQSEPEEYIDPQPQNSTTGIVKPSLTEQEMSPLVHEGTTFGVEDHEVVEENANGDEENNKMQHVLDPPLSEVDAGSNEVNVITRDDKSEPEACAEQNLTTDIVEPCLTEQDMSGQLVDEGNAIGVGVEDKKVDEALACDKGEDGLMESNRMLVEENERLRVMMENLIRSGQEQVTAISRLTGRVKDLERRISSRSKKNKLKMRRRGGDKIMRAHNDE